MATTEQPGQFVEHRAGQSADGAHERAAEHPFERDRALGTRDDGHRPECRLSSAALRQG